MFKWLNSKLYWERSRMKNRMFPGKGSISAVLAHVGIDLGMSKKIEEGNNNQTVIKFSVPVILPSIDNKRI